MLPLARELEPFFWTTYSVLALKPDWWTVPTMELVHITVSTLKMLVSDAVLHVCIIQQQYTYFMQQSDIIIMFHFTLSSCDSTPLHSTLLQWSTETSGWDTDKRGTSGGLHE